MDRENRTMLGNVKLTVDVVGQSNQSYEGIGRISLKIVENPFIVNNITVYIELGKDTFGHIHPTCI